MENDPLAVVAALRLSRASYRQMGQNVLWATGYNVVAPPLTAGVASAWGVLLSLAVGAVLMSASTVIVAVNAMLLRRRRRLDNEARSGRRCWPALQGTAWLLCVRLPGHDGSSCLVLRAPLDARTARHVTQGRDIA